MLYPSLLKLLYITNQYRFLKICIIFNQYFPVFLYFVYKKPLKFSPTFSYIDDKLIIDNTYFDNNVRRIYHAELQLIKANTSDTDAWFLDLRLFISNDIVSTKICAKRAILIFEIVNFSF